MTQHKMPAQLMRHITAAVLLLFLQPGARAQDSFVGDGVILGDTAGSMAIATDTDFMYVASAERAQWGVEKRRLSDGALVPGFGVGGVLGIAGSDEPRALATGSGFLFIAGADQAW